MPPHIATRSREPAPQRSPLASQRPNRRATRCRRGACRRLDGRLRAVVGDSRRVRGGRRGAPAALDATARLARLAGPGRRIPALRCRRPSHPQSRNVLPRSRRDLRTGLAAEPDAAADPRGGMARDRARRRATRRAVGKGAVRRLRRGPSDRRGRSSRRRAQRLSRLRTRDARRQAAGQAVAAPVRRRYRAGTRRAMVGLGRPHAGAFRFGLRAGESLGRFPGLPVPLSRDERRAARALLPRIARGAEGERRALGAADRNIYARPVERDLFRAGLSRALSRLSAGGGRGSRDAGRPRVRAHDRRPQARRCALAPRRRRMVRSARAQLGLAYRSAGAAGRDPRRRRRDREHAGLWTRGSARAAAVPAETRAAPARRGPRDAEHRDLVVRAALETVSVAGAFDDALPGFDGLQSVVGGELDARERARLRAAIETRGVDYVGQDIVRLSTMPRWEHGRLVPRPFVLRVYAAATPEGWRVMPGGFARVSDKSDARAVSMTGGVESADVWVLADSPVETTSLLPTPERGRIVRMLGNLPSRAADNLFWFGRYLEREEATLRLVRCLCSRAVDPDAPHAGAQASIERLKNLLVAWGAIHHDQVEATSAEAGEAALRDPLNYGSALSIARHARDAASVIRERLTPQTWQLIGRLKSVILEAPQRGLGESEILDCVDEALTTIAALAGLFDENFNRGAGWIFYELGRRIERGINTCRLARQFGYQEATEHNLDVLLDLIDSQITYRSRTLIGVALAPVRDMSLLDPFNPRSVAFQAKLIAEHIAALPLLRHDGLPEEPIRLATLLSAELAAEYADEIEDQGILAFEQKLAALAEAIAVRYFLQGASQARAEKVLGLA